jgi:hypothetical protein
VQRWGGNCSLCVTRSVRLFFASLKIFGKVFLAQFSRRCALLLFRDLGVILFVPNFLLPVQFQGKF